MSLRISNRVIARSVTGDIAKDNQCNQTTPRQTTNFTNESSRNDRVIVYANSVSIYARAELQTITGRTCVLLTVGALTPVSAPQISALSYIPV